MRQLGLGGPLAATTRVTPLAPDRGTGQVWARQELAKPEYAQGQPSVWSRIRSWIGHRLDDLFGHGGLDRGHVIAVGLTVIVVAAVVIALVLRHRVRGAGAHSTGAPTVLGDSTLTGAEHRRRAERALADGRPAEAVREWMRAIARRLDERALLDPRPGRTADELGREAAALFPGLASALLGGARTFDDVSYGSTLASLADAEQLRRLDEAVEQAVPVAASLVAAGWSL